MFFANFMANISRMVLLPLWINSSQSFSFGQSLNIWNYFKLKNPLFVCFFNGCKHLPNTAFQISSPCKTAHPRHVQQLFASAHSTMKTGNICSGTKIYKTFYKFPFGWTHSAQCQFSSTCRQYQTSGKVNGVMERSQPWNSVEVTSWQFEIHFNYFNK